MRCFLADIRSKEVINARTGMRLGYVSDVEVDVESGRITSIVVPGDNRWFGFGGRSEDYIIHWEDIMTMGDDLILVNIPKKLKPMD